MTDQIPADKVRPILDEWERIKEHADWVDMDNLVQSVRALLPAPTLADMTPEERAACRRMQCDYALITRNTTSRGVIGYFDHEEKKAVILTDTCGIVRRNYASVTPRPDLPRLEWPGTEEVAPAPAPDKPSLPGGWRLANHPGGSMTPQIIRTREQLDALDPDTLVANRIPTRDGVPYRMIQAWPARVAHRLDLTWSGPMVVVATGDHFRAARQALENGNAAN